MSIYLIGVSKIYIIDVASSIINHYHYHWFWIFFGLLLVLGQHGAIEWKVSFKHKALGIDEVFVSQNNAASCSAGVKFTSVPTGFTATDLPSYADTTKARPSQIWDTKPTAPSCILEGDVETNCD